MRNGHNDDNDDDGPQEMQAEGFVGYEPTSVDPSPWLLLGTSVVCLAVVLVVVPMAVSIRRTTKHQEEGDDEKEEEEKSGDDDSSETKPPQPQQQQAASTSILSFDEETRKILRLGLPYTVSNVSSEFFSNVCLILVSQFIGTRDVAAYALVHILVQLTDETLHGIVYSCSTLCAHAVGAGNFVLAGQYVQLAVALYLSLNIPVVFFWWNYMHEVILYLQWGDEVTAQLAQTFVRTFLWSRLLVGITTTIWQLLEVTDHAGEAALLDLLRGILNVGSIAALAFKSSIALHQVGIIFSCTALVCLGITVVWSRRQGWLEEFHKGIFQSLAITNLSALDTMIRTAIPLAGSSLSSGAEWAVLTVFASHLGPAEVAAWAILGNIWDLFYYLSSGFGTAAEIRTSLHLGDNHPALAKLSTYKSLLLGFMFAATVSIVFFGLKDILPAWYTPDASLQRMLRELVPFVGVSNLTMSFGMDCWSVVGAQGKFHLATWISLLSTWGICMPLAAIFTLHYRFNLQGLMAASTLGYVTTGACLSYVVLSTDWTEIALKISQANSAEEEDEQDEVETPTLAVEEVVMDKSTRNSVGSADEMSPLLGDKRTTEPESVLL